jgi:S-adenosylmethionine:tRNA ribosyltransferase-isomerase
LSIGADTMGDRGGFTFQLEDYSYDLPSSLIAQCPAERREASRLLIVDRRTGRLEHRQFEDILMFLRPGDVLVVNDTRVVPARLFGTKESGGRVELLVLDPYKDADLGEREGYECLLKSAKRPRPGSVILLEDGFRAEVLAPVKEGRTRTRFISSEPLLDVLGRIGKIPLPPYIQRTDNGHRADDVTAYQTVYAQTPGAVAAPTAGLHFSRPLLERFAGCGVTLATVTLHVGFGTFAPVRTEDIRKHRMHSEYVEISSAAAKTINDAAREGRRIVAVGTTVVRALEWVAIKSGQVTSFSGLCDHFIFPGYRFRIIDSLITNFHLPKSTLLLLVSAFAGREEVLNAYQEAISRRYRFYSYGDAMLIL